MAANFAGELIRPSDDTQLGLAVYVVLESSRPTARDVTHVGGAASFGAVMFLETAS
jgi:hypothetical protein